MRRCRSYRYLLQPTIPQRMRLEQLLRNQCELYNAALEERRGAWKWERRSVSYFDQTRTLTTLREIRPEVLEHGVTVCRGTLKRLDRAFCAFYRRCRAGQTPGFPRFKSWRRFDSVQWEDTKRMASRHRQPPIAPFRDRRSEGSVSTEISRAPPRPSPWPEKDGDGG